MKNDEILPLKQAPTSFAPAVTPVAETTIHTDTDGLHAGQTTIPSQGEDLPAYLARPEQFTGKLPIILVVQEIFGVHEHIQDVCRRLAKQGYLAIAPSCISVKETRAITLKSASYLPNWSVKCRISRYFPILTTRPTGRRSTAAISPN